ncbi:hypothetical protein [Vallitalea sp.]|jgi:hypothetical protein|uniref:hypothetical protein n=1 Tax=Vallitalea sp. TaxID=1882829 RepID=UPI0025DDA915|nr:hypothetical protein [Vallitalea sp.]MCT4686017.1 hypothetical protein [Vallitalea sp.]
MKINRILMITLLIVLVLTSCKQNIIAKENVVVPDKKASSEIVHEEVKSIDNLFGNHKYWNKIGQYDTNYVKLKDINKEDIKEIGVDFSMLGESSAIQELSDGYIVVGLKNVKSKRLTNSKGTFNYKPILQKLDETGKIVWVKELNENISSSSIKHLLTFEDDSFLFAVDSYPQWINGKLTKENSYIVKFDKKGNQLWKQEFNNYSTDMFIDILLTNAEEILVIGECMAKDYKSYINKKQIVNDDSSNDIVITKLDAKGNIVRQKIFGGSDDDNLYVSKYDKDMGIIIKGRTKSKDGSFAINTKEDNKIFVACINEKNLKIKWVHHLEENYSPYNQLYVDNGLVYVAIDRASTHLKKNKGKIITINNEGKVTKTITHIYTESERWSDSMITLSNHDIIVGCGNQNLGTLRIFSDSGKEKKIIKNLNLSPNEIIPTDDGGFIIKSIREIEVIPQPSYISSIWFDHEVVIIKYDSNYNVKWRKTYDKYKGSIEVDKVIPLKNGKVIIEKQNSLNAIQVDGKSISPVEGLKIKDARELIINKLVDMGVKGDINKVAIIEEITTQEMWENVGAQVYKVDVNYACIYGVAIIKDNKVLEILYGMPTLSVFLADLDEDGVYELYTNIAKGSGIISYEILGYNIATQERYHLAKRGRKDYSLLVDNNTLMAKVYRYPHLQKIEKIGKVRLKTNGDKWEIDVDYYIQNTKK